MDSNLSASERRQIVELFNETARPYPHDRLIQDLFEERVRQTPEAVAVRYAHEVLTYAGLNRRANQLARYLRQLGLEIGEYLPILMPRCLQMLVAQLAVLKSGGVYVPMDPTQPPERQAFMIRDCRARWVLAEEARAPCLKHEPVQWIDCTRVAHLIDSFPVDDPSLKTPVPPPAYVMYTSGSTGVPKGVVVPHRAVNRLVINNGYTCVEPHDCFAHCSNPAFDASTFEIWGGLLNGASVLIVSQSDVLEADGFAELLKKQHVTVLWLTVGLFTQYAHALSTVFARLRYLVVGGDVVHPETVRQVLRQNPPRHLLNGYGPTEGTTFSTTCLIEAVPEDARGIPIGRPISNTRTYVLNDQLQPVGIGETGEIHIGGDGVALGYLNRPELTAERFIADPFAANSRARLYKSGDLGRWSGDGMLEYLGRNDQQVKIRGFRIELGEIEARLTRHPQVADAVVRVHEENAGEKQLVAYVVPRGAQCESPLVMPQLRAHLRDVLPEYMMPSRWVMLSQMPLTPNGKVDRRALPAPPTRPEEIGEYVAPRTETEHTVAKIWQQVLRVDHLGTRDNFFDLGGHSFHAMKLVATTVAQLGVELSFIDVLQFPTVEKMAALIESRRPEADGQSCSCAVDYEQGVI